MEPFYIPDNSQNISKCKICKKPKSFESKLVNGICENCLTSNKDFPQNKVIVKNYEGSQSTSTELFKQDSIKMAEKGYFPTSQNWAPGSYGCGSFILALILCVILIGILVFIYMLIVKPDGTLSVTYELKSLSEKEKVNDKLTNNEKECPQCAEFVKIKAKICRFCRYEFEKTNVN